MGTRIKTPQGGSVPEFEFESPTDSPYHYLNQPNDSPADLFFIKGRLVPHVFKVQDTTKNETTRRSSSLNSGGGGGSGGSTESIISWSSGSSKTAFSNRSSSVRTSLAESMSMGEISQEKRHGLSSTNCAYGSSKKLQVLAPAPVMNNGVVKKKKVLEIRGVDYLDVTKEVQDSKGRKSGFRRRLFRLFCLPVESSTVMDA